VKITTYIDKKALLINLACIEAGIIPFTGMKIDHVKTTLGSMSIDDRKIIVRKFRKVLKRAIKHAALQDATSELSYKTNLEQIKKHTGLKLDLNKKLTNSHRNCRRYLVMCYMKSISNKPIFKKEAYDKF
jgi:hypothetical protein